ELEKIFSINSSTFTILKNVVLPVGISFYTFQTISYTIDVYRNKIEVSKNFLNFAVYVAYFPQLVAGPIERAVNLLPQIQNKRKFCYNQAVDGMRQIVWGVFKKVVIADHCAQIINPIFENSVDYNGITLILGAILFSFQIYGDFSGYSDIAIGTSKLLGIKLIRNFNLPYFSRDIAEFWRRWHVSLSSWFKDYLYIPLGGSKKGTLISVRNIFIIFMISGIWHGANWTFIFWGLIHVLLYIPLFLLERHRSNIFFEQGKSKKISNQFFKRVITFLTVSLAWIFFRSETVFDAFEYLINIFDNLLLFPGQSLLYLKKPVIIFILLMVITEWLTKEYEHPLKILEKNKSIINYISYYILFGVIFFFGLFEEQAFIYFQF
ncbi:MAG: MBOAT family protein, partial [Bacteroidales bacterium]|nr:MBOAT family protein [Bacteroidales bacterium]